MTEFDAQHLFNSRRTPLGNAVQLQKDSGVLCEAERWSTAFFLTQIATEELGKYCVIVSSAISLFHGSRNWKRFINRFKSHREKTQALLRMERLHNFINGSASNLLDPSGNLTYAQLQETSKMVSLYCDFGDDGQLHNPSELFGEKMCGMTMHLLASRIDIVNSFERDVTEAGLIVDSHEIDRRRDR